MTLPDRSGTRAVEVRRILDIEEDELVDAITAFAVAQDLELDRRYEDGLLFRRAHTSQNGESHLFDRFDGLRVHITEVGNDLEVEFVADLRGSLKNRAEKRRGDAIGSAVGAAIFAWFGIRGLTNVVGFMDFVWLGLSATFGARAVGHLRSAEDDFDELERKIVNELNRVCDDAMYD